MTFPARQLSERQRRILEFLRSFLRSHQYPPTVREIQGGCGISSTSVVDYNLRILGRDGYIRRSPDISRGIELVEPGSGRVLPMPSMVPVQVIGAIAAGEPLPVFTDGVDAEATETVELPSTLAPGPGPTYALRVKGLSMVDALIDDGDIVVLERVAEVRDGDMVAAWLVQEQEATLKRIYREGERVRLQPANSLMQPVFVEARNLEVHGRVVGVFRTVS